MSLPEREGLIARIRQTRRLAEPAAPASSGSISSCQETEPARVHALETRIAHLESLLEGLQDAVHRESGRQSKRIADLEARTDPAALAVALSRNARDRGL